MIYGHRHQGGYEIPEWAQILKHHYWMIRVEGRDKAKRRRYYRYVSKEKLRLAELGIDQELIKAVCRYLASLNSAIGIRMKGLVSTPNMQMKLEF